MRKGSGAVHRLANSHVHVLSKVLMKNSREEKIVTGGLILTQQQEPGFGQRQQDKRAVDSGNIPEQN